MGATGTVGQRFCQLLENHPQFEITALAASDRSTGKPYAEACAWKLAGAMPENVKDIEVQPIEPPLDCEIVFSSLPSTVARETEEAFARAGYPVISNSSSYRMDEDIPLLIPEINAEHLGLIKRQQEKRGFGNRIYRHESELRGRQFCAAACRSASKIRNRIRYCNDLAGDFRRGLSGRFVARYYRQCSAVYRGRRTESRNRSAENSRHFCGRRNRKSRLYSFGAMFSRSRD